MPRRSIPDLVNTFHLSVFLFFLLQFVNCKQQLIDGNLFVLRIFRKFSDLVTTLEKAEDVAVYAKHPEHVKVADTYVRPYTTERAALDYEE